MWWLRMCRRCHTSSPTGYLPSFTSESISILRQKCLWGTGRMIDSGVVAHINTTIQAARLKGARTIVTGISDAVAETVVDLGVDWSDVDTLADLQTGLHVAWAAMRQRHARARRY
jgi:hypothetical protein